MRHLAGPKAVRSLAYSPTGLLVSGGGDRTVQIWNPAAGEPVEVIKAQRVVYAVAVAPDETIAYAGRSTDSQSRTNTIPLWNLRNGRSDGEYAWQMERSGYSIWSLSFSADGEYLAAAGRRLGGANYLNGAGGHWWQRKKPFAAASLPDRSIFAVSFAPSGTVLAVTCRRTIGIHKRRDEVEQIRFKLPVDWAAAVAIDREGIATVGASQFLYFGDTASGGRLRKLSTGIPRIKSLAVSPDGRTLVVGGRPGAVEVYDLPGRTLRHKFDFGLGDVDAIAFAPDGLTYAVGGEGGLVVCDLG